MFLSFVFIIKIINTYVSFGMHYAITDILELIIRIGQLTLNFLDQKDKSNASQHAVQIKEGLRRV